MATSAAHDETVRYERAVSSGSALFAKLSVLVHKDEKVKRISDVFRDYIL